MKSRTFFFTCSSLFLLAACDQQAEESTAAAEPEVATTTAAPDMAEEAILQIEITKNGYGRAAEAGDVRLAGRLGLQEPEQAGVLER